MKHLIIHKIIYNPHNIQDWKNMLLLNVYFQGTIVFFNLNDLN